MVADVLLIRHRFDERFNHETGIGERTRVGAERPVYRMELHRDPVAFNGIDEPARLGVRARDHKGAVESFVGEPSRSRERMEDCDAQRSAWSHDAAKLLDCSLEVVDILERHEGDRLVCDRVRERQRSRVANHRRERLVVRPRKTGQRW
jgi:hypothetical protein